MAPTTLVHPHGLSDSEPQIKPLGVCASRESNATEEDAVSRADNGRGASNEGGEGGDDDGEEEDSAEGDEEYDEDFMDGPAEWADVDEAELQEAVIRLCSLRLVPCHLDEGMPCLLSEKKEGRSRGREEARRGGKTMALAA